MARVKKLIETENDVKGLVKQELDSWRAWSYAPIQTGMGAHGIPDRIACVPVMVTQEIVGRPIGLFVAIEAKRPGRRGERNAGATGQQVDQLDSIINASGAAMLCDGRDDIVQLNALLHTDTAGIGIWKSILVGRLRGSNG